MFEVNKYLKTILHNNDTIIVSCSGGPDSMCLLSLILAFKKEYNLNIICAHVNHHVREESDAEEKFVNNFCVINNIIFKKLDITNYNDNFHADARHQRYVFLDKLMKEEKAKYLMTAHHGDDLIETMLMRTQRGSNLRGYIGFKRDNIYHNYHIVRPLITLTKEEIKTYDDNNNILFFIFLQF